VAINILDKPAASIFSADFSGKHVTYSVALRKEKIVAVFN
jgi:putative IMPACT (imprinted ancient) family translation regulator